MYQWDTTPASHKYGKRKHKNAEREHKNAEREHKHAEREHKHAEREQHEGDAYQWETTPASHKVPGNIVKKVNLLTSIRVSAQGSHRHEAFAVGDSNTPWDRNSPRG